MSDKNGLTLLEETAGAAAQAFGRMCAFHGQMGMFVRAYAYMLSHGSMASDRLLRTQFSTPTTSRRGFPTS